MTAAFLLVVGSASALTLGVGWSGNGGRDAEEMPIVAASGATTFRIPQGAITDTLVEDAARNNVTILAQLGGGTSLPSNRAKYGTEVATLVKKYGVNGSFWSQRPNLPARPITTWEIWNEPNAEGIPAPAFGEFVSEVADAIHSASLGGNPEVLSGGLLVWGNSPHGEAGATKYLGALQYLEEAYAHFGSNPNVSGVAIHPYELDPESFHQPGFTALQAFEYAVSEFRGKLNLLATFSSTSQKQLSITEFGWPAKGGQWNVGEAQQATFLGQAVDYARANEANLQITNLDWYNFRDATEEKTEWARYCGLRADDLHFRPAWTEFQAKAGVTQFIPQAPTVETGSATAVAVTQATLNGSVNPNGFPTRYKFEYGTTTAYGSSVPISEGDAGSGKASVPVSVSLKGLDPGTTYHYRIVGTSAVMPTGGLDRTFTTRRSPGDYDGDGKTDIAVYRPGSPASTFFVNPSGGGNGYTVQLGTAGDIPLTGDFNGDGKTDIAVYRPGSPASTFFVNPSGGGNGYSVQLGSAGDIPLTGDYDGDGRTDIAVYRPGSPASTFFVNPSGGGNGYSVQLGAAGDTALVGDFDGDGKTDVAVYRPGSPASTFFINPSGGGNGYTAQLGAAADTPLAK